jgi:peroxiredoxin
MFRLLVLSLFRQSQFPQPSGLGFARGPLGRYDGRSLFVTAPRAFLADLG